MVGKPITDLDNILKSKNAYATIRTVDHQRGEIQGQILSSSSNIPCLTYFEIRSSYHFAFT
jgi:hypothetical protein